MFATLMHERNCMVTHIGNRIVFTVPLHFENGMMVKKTIVETGRLTIEAIKRLDVDIREQQEKQKVKEILQ